MDFGISHETLASLLQLYVAIPLVAAGLLTALRKVQWLQDVVLSVVLLAALGGAGALIAITSDGDVLAHGTGGWAPGVAIPFAADMFSALMLTIVSVLALACVWFATASGYSREPFFAPFILVLMTGVFGTLLTADIFNFFVFIEVMLLPSYGLYAMTIHRRGGSLRVAGLRLYIGANLFASTLLLVSAGLIYATAGAVNLGQLAGAAKEDPAVAIASGLALLSMMIKASVVPTHSWLSRSYPYTSPAITTLFSGLHTKVAIYAIYRWYAVLFDGDSRWLWIGIVLFSLTMLIGVLGAVGENTTREILTFHMVSHIGYILLGVAMFTELGMTAGIFYLIHHMVVKTSLFMSTGAIEVKYGTGELGKATNMMKREPVLGVAFFAAALSLVGIPPFSGFVAKFGLMLAAWEATEYVAMIMMVVVSLLTLVAMLKIWNGVFWGDTKQPAPDPAAGQDPDGEGATLGGGVAIYPESDGTSESTSTAVSATGTATATEPHDHDTEYKDSHRVGGWLAAPAVMLAVLSLAIGVGAEVLMNWSEVAAQGLLDTSSYVEAVNNH